MRRHYLTKNEYETAEHRIYNDLPVFMAEDLSEIRSKFNEENIKELLLPEEEYNQIKEADQFIITSYGRVINTHTKTIIKPNITGNTLHYPLNYVHLNCKRDFKAHGWRYDHKEVVKRYVENNWRYRMTYKGKIEDLFI
jgi:hypothetical protein